MVFRLDIGVRLVEESIRWTGHVRYTKEYVRILTELTKEGLKMKNNYEIKIDEEHNEVELKIRFTKEGLKTLLELLEK